MVANGKNYNNSDKKSVKCNTFFKQYFNNHFDLEKIRKSFKAIFLIF